MAARIGASDAHLVSRARRGDAPAFETLIRRHYSGAYQTALAITHNPMDAEDVCQDAFLKALRALDSCRQPDRFASWLHQIVRNRARNLWAYERLRAAMSLEHAPELNDARSGREHCIGLREELGGALQQLTDLQRQVTLLHDVEGWRHREIATSLGISPEASRQHLFVARRRLRKQLRRDLWEEYTE